MSYANIFLSFSSLVCALLIFTGKSSALQCYECNSHNDSRCADLMPPDSLKTECSKMIDGHATKLCRKITQIIEFEVNGLPPDSRVIRSCGWDDSTYKNKCYHRSGFGGRQEVCACDSDFCNSAPRTMTTTAIPLTFVAIVLLKLCM
ncbi:uncharacterized protein CBL_09155 [Carabus blaptoides fortunei]